MKGRTYRYFSDPLFAFGYGPSYTTFALGAARIEKSNLKAGNVEATLTIPVTNAGKQDGSEVVQLYVRDLADTEGPLKSLRAFQRVDVKAGQTANVRIPLTSKTFELFDPQTNTVHAHSGRYELLYGNSSRPEDLKRMELTLE